jgi:hypothetical protein
MMLTRARVACKARQARRLLLRQGFPDQPKLTNCVPPAGQAYERRLRRHPPCRHQAAFGTRWNPRRRRETSFPSALTEPRRLQGTQKRLKLLVELNASDSPGQRLATEASYCLPARTIEKGAARRRGRRVRLCLFSVDDSTTLRLGRGQPEQSSRVLSLHQAGTTRWRGKSALPRPRSPP